MIEQKKNISPKKIDSFVLLLLLCDHYQSNAAGSMNTINSASLILDIGQIFD